jgi:type I restriction enzyme S subunit
MEEWKEYKISDVIDEISMGPFGSNIKVDNFIDFGVPVLNGSNLQGFKLQEESFNYVSQEKADSLGKANAHRGDVVITHRGTLGQIVYIPQDSKFEQYVISQSQFRLKLKQDLIRPDFFVYFFHTPKGKHRILMNASQVGVPALARPTSTFKEVFVPVPPLETQNAIMAILSSLDKKIEVNKRLNDNLEQQAQALFKSWFVDFEPFKDGEFVESEMGMIPKGWKVGTLGELCAFKRGKNLLTKDSILGEVPVVAGGLEPSCYHNVANTKSPVITVSGSGANAGFMRMYYQEVWASDCSFIDSTCENLFFVYCFLTINRRLLRHAQTGAVQPHVKPADIHNFELVIPPKDIINQFQRIVSDTFTMRGSIEKESRRLSQLRDALLPRLMSGELKVNEIEMP